MAVRNGKARDEARRIDEFWDWWDDARGRIGAALDAGTVSQVEGELTEAVQKLDPEVLWELGVGQRARHQLCLSSAGDPGRRALLERWWQAGPEDDDDWETHPARTAVPMAVLGDMVLEVNGSRLAFAEAEFEAKVDEQRERLDVMVWHPAFEALDDEAQWDVLSLVLDDALGEDDVERWLGAVGPSAEPLDDPRPLLDLPTVVGELAARATGDRWQVFKSKAPDGVPIAVVANRALKRIDFADHEHHVAVRITPDLATFGEHGTQVMFSLLDDVEEQLLARIGDAAVYVGRETRLDRIRRTLHLYTTKPGPIVAKVKAWGSDHPEWGAGVDTSVDAGWDAVDHILK